MDRMKGSLKALGFTDRFDDPDVDCYKGPIKPEDKKPRRPTWKKKKKEESDDEPTLHRVRHSEPFNFTAHM